MEAERELNLHRFINMKGIGTITQILRKLVKFSYL